MSDQTATVKVGDLVIYVDQYGEGHVGEIRALIQDESTGGEAYARVEMEGAAVWEHAPLLRPVDPSEIETDEDF